MRILTAYTKTDFDRHYASGAWTSETLTDALARVVDANPDRIAIVQGDRRLTYRELATVVEEVAAGLAASGVRREDVVSVQLPNSVELAATILALARIGAVYNPLNPGYRRQEVETITGLVEPVAVVAPARYRDFDYPALLDEVLGEGVALRVVVGDSPSAAWTSFDDLRARGRDAARGGLELGTPTRTPSSCSGRRREPPATPRSTSTPRTPSSRRPGASTRPWAARARTCCWPWRR